MYFDLLFLTSCKQQFFSEKAKSPRRLNPHSVQDAEGRLCEIVDELSIVGYNDDMDLNSLFEKNGKHILRELFLDVGGGLVSVVVCQD